MSHVRFREHMDLSKSISERIAERKRKGEEEAARRRGIAERVGRLDNAQTGLLSNKATAESVFPSISRKETFLPKIETRQTINQTKSSLCSPSTHC